jgi:hypothetical protein
MAMAPTSEQQSQRIDLGQRLFLVSVFGVLVTEALATIVNIGHAFTWTGTLLGIVSAVVILYLGNRLFVGDRPALTASRVWVALELVLVLIALGILLGDTPAESSIPVHLNISAAWQGWLKLAAYAGFAAALFLPGFVLDFFAAQRGDAAAGAAVAAVETAPISAEPVTLANDQTQALEALNGTLKGVSALVLAVGGFDLLVGLFNIKKSTDVGLLSIVEGLAVVGLGAAVILPCQPLQALLTATPRTMQQAMAFLTALATSLAAYVVPLVALAAVVILRLFL